MSFVAAKMQQTVQVQVTIIPRQPGKELSVPVLYTVLKVLRFIKYELVIILVFLNVHCIKILTQYFELYVFYSQFLVGVSVCRFKSQPYLAQSSGISIDWRADSWLAFRLLKAIAL